MCFNRLEETPRRDAARIAGNFDTLRGKSLYRKSPKRLDVEG